MNLPSVTPTVKALKLLNVCLITSTWWHSYTSTFNVTRAKVNTKGHLLSAVMLYVISSMLITLCCTHMPRQISVPGRMHLHTACLNHLIVVAKLFESFNPWCTWVRNENVHRLRTSEGSEIDRFRGFWYMVYVMQTVCNGFFWAVWE